jgi:hypothetical protein
MPNFDTVERARSERYRDLGKDTSKYRYDAEVTEFTCELIAKRGRENVVKLFDLYGKNRNIETTALHCSHVWNGIDQHARTPRGIHMTCRRPRLLDCTSRDAVARSWQM